MIGVNARAEFMCYVPLEIYIYSTVFFISAGWRAHFWGMKVFGKCTQGCIPEEGQDTTGWSTIEASVSSLVAWQSGTTGYTGANSISAWNNSCHRTSQNVRPNCFRPLLDGFLLGNYEWSQSQNSQALWPLPLLDRTPADDQRGSVQFQQTLRFFQQNMSWIRLFSPNVGEEGKGTCWDLYAWKCGRMGGVHQHLFHLAYRYASANSPNSQLSVCSVTTVSYIEMLLVWICLQYVNTFEARLLKNRVLFSVVSIWFSIDLFFGSKKFVEEH